MSRILRRPMFRGGRVSSYGTGIAAPLVPGYRGGGQIGGGIIYGIPHRDGRYGFQEPYIPIWARDADTRGYAIGADLQPTGIYDTTNLRSTMGANQNILTQDTEKEIGSEGDVITVTKGDIFAEEEAKQKAKEKKAAEMGITVAEMEAIEKENLSEAGLKDIQKEEILKATLPTKSNLELENERLRAELAEALRGSNTGESIDIDKETYFKALGGDKARAADISNTLLGFAGAEGDDTWSKFKSFFRDEAKRPSESKKLKEAAAMLAIKDHIAGKRADEQLAKILGMEGMRAKLGKKNLAEQISIAEKTLPMNSVAAIKRGVEMWDEGAIVDVQPDANYEVGPEDEGNYIIESDTKTVYKIVKGKKKKIR